VVVDSIKRSFAALAICVAGFVTMGSAPALAETAAVSAEVATPVANANVSTLSSTRDEQFAKLFADWEALDGNGNGDRTQAPTAPATTVSIPSRMPLDSGRLTSGYGMRTHPILGGRRGHNGIDIGAPTGTPIYATGDGLVSRANRSRTYGNVVYMEHGAEMQTRFAHMSRIAVVQGQRVKKGDVIGYVGSTGRSTGPHLHYEVRVSGRSVNPTRERTDPFNRRANALQGGVGGRGGK
jgi:murein DD-endopeptidase MepM/ murein hydrolase activator NlpD